MIITELAHQDLDKIVSYTAVELDSPIAAGNFLGEVEECYGHLKFNPWMYGKCQNRRLEKEEYRSPEK